MDKSQMVQFWDDLWKKNMWWPAFSNSFADLTAEQAAWRPQAGRNSIWQNLNHISFWREVVVRRIDGEKPSDEEVERRNFEQPAEPSERAWKDALARDGSPTMSSSRWPGVTILPSPSSVKSAA